MKAELNKQLNSQELASLIREYQYGRYREDGDITSESSEKILGDHIKKYLSQEETECIQVRSSEGISGILLFKLSKWDTEHFGFPYAIIDSIIIKNNECYEKLKVANQLLQEFNDWTTSRHIRFVSVKLPAMDLPVIHSFERFGFEYLESWIFNKYDLRKNNIKQPSFSLRDANTNDEATMIEFSKGAYSTQRFHADFRFDSKKADSLYKKWIKTAFQDNNQKIVALDIKNKPAAYMIYYENDFREYCGLRFTMWKLALIDPDMRGKGVGTDFFEALKFHHQQEGMDIIDSGISLRNMSTFNLHNKSGFKVISTIVTFHKWLKDTSLSTKTNQLFLLIINGLYTIAS